MAKHYKDEYKQYVCRMVIEDKILMAQLVRDLESRKSKRDAILTTFRLEVTANGRL